MATGPTTSLAAWMVAVLIGAILYVRNRRYDRWNAIFLWSFAFIQLLEFGLWIALNNGTVNTVSLLTSILLIALWFQPFVQSYAGYYYVSQKGAVLWQEIILVLMSIVYVSLVAYAIVRAFDPEQLGIPKNQRIRTTIGPNGKLVWVDEAATANGGWFLDGGIAILTAMYIIGLLVPVIFQGWRGLILAAFGIVSLGLAYWFSTSSESGSTWSYVAIAYGLVALLL